MKEKRKLKNKVAVVTGGGKGIGKSIALAFAEEGAIVVICGRTKSLLQQVCQEAEEDATIVPIQVDVSVESQVENMVTQVINKLGKIDILVNNAGILGPTQLLADVSKEAWDEVINTNLTGSFLCSRAVLRHMIRMRSGNIINISADSGRIGGRVRSIAYNVSKFGMEGLTYALAVQMKLYGICVNAIRPGVIDTDILKDAPELKGEMEKPDAVRRIAIYMALQKVDTMTGKSINRKDWEQRIREI